MWGLFNALMIWFAILNPEPHHSYLSHFGSLSLPSSSLGVCENDKRSIELGTGLKVSSGRFGELGFGGTANFSLKFRLSQRYFGEIHIADLSDEEQPYIGLQGEIGRCGFPKNISSDALMGFSLKLISGINFQYKWFNSCFSLAINRGNFSPAFSISFLK